MTELLFAVCMAIATCRGLPDGLAAPAHDDGGSLTSIVVADIDRDGDADVVATDGALHLFVWINDGRGHLTRQTPAPAGEDAADGQHPDVGWTPLDSDAYTSADPPSCDAPVFAATARVFIRRAAASGAPHLHPERCRSAERLRGPPADSPRL